MSYSDPMHLTGTVLMVGSGALLMIGCFFLSPPDSLPDLEVCRAMRKPTQFTPGYEGTHSLPRYAMDGASARRSGKRRVPPAQLSLESREAWLCGWDHANDD